MEVEASNPRRGSRRQVALGAAAAGEDPAAVEAGEKKARRGPSSYIRRRFRCLRPAAYGDGGPASAARVDQGPAEEGGGGRRVPTHLVVMVNGIIGSAGNWRFAAKQFAKKLPEDIIVHRSECNCNLLTLDGVDVMGERLAKEVLSIIERRPELQKISFVGHSLGGLITRYAIASLYEPNLPQEPSQGNGDCKGLDTEAQFLDERSKGKIAGLEPMNFITFATPHLGSRWHRQIPLFCGFYVLEKMAARSSWMFGRTGKHLFLKDSDEGKPPLLLQMVIDCEDLQFISALRSFKRRVAYSNASYDHIVGWKTSSIRRRQELPKRQLFTKNCQYPHIVHVELPKTVNVEQEISLDTNIKTVDMEEAMIKGLNMVTWERIDVSFRNSRQRFLAHNTIQVKTYCINSDGADVIFHTIDNFLL